MIQQLILAIDAYVFWSSLHVQAFLTILSAWLETTPHKVPNILNEFCLVIDIQSNYEKLLYLII